VIRIQHGSCTACHFAFFMRIKLSTRGQRRWSVMWRKPPWPRKLRWIVIPVGGDAPDPTRWRISRRSCPPRHSWQDPPGPRIIRFCARAGKTPAAPALDVRGRSGCFSYRAVRRGRRRCTGRDRALAQQIIKHDGKPIVPSYITDIEKGRGIPRDYIARQFAKVLRIPVIALLEACEKDRVTVRGGADH
jgi:hypothetical protein